MNRYSKMTNDELRTIAAEKVKSTGQFKKSSIMAQHELWSRHHWTDNKRVHDDGFQARATEDIDYNG